MRTALDGGLVVALGLALGLALAGCAPRDPAAAAPAAPSAAPSAPAPAERAGQDEIDASMECMAHIDLLRQAITDGRASGDAAVLAAESARLRARILTAYTADELAQYYASSVAVFDDVPVDALTRIVDRCLTARPRPGASS